MLLEGVGGGLSIRQVHHWVDAHPWQKLTLQYLHLACLREEELETCHEMPWLSCVQIL